MSTIVQYVVVRGDLLKLQKWPVGALIAQACHASSAAIHLFYEAEDTKQYLSDLDRMHKVVLEAQDEGSLSELATTLTASKIDHKLWVEQPENYPTCLATRPYPKQIKTQREYQRDSLARGSVRFMSVGGEFGSGAGKGGGAGGSVREAGGAFGKMEAAHEELYFKKLEREQLQKLRKHLEEEVDYHKDQIDDHKQGVQLDRIREQVDDVVAHHQRSIREHQQALQLQRIKEHLEEEVDHHEKAIREHQEAIERHKKKIQKLHHQEKDISDKD